MTSHWQLNGRTLDFTDKLQLETVSLSAHAVHGDLHDDTERCINIYMFLSNQIMKCQACATLLCVLVLVLAGPYTVNGVADREETSPKPILQRSEAKRWERVHQIVQSEIKAATKKFLTDRDQVSPSSLDLAG